MSNAGPRATHPSPWPAHGAALSWTAFVCLVLVFPGDHIQPLTDRFTWALPAATDKLIHGLLFFFETLFLIPSLRYLRPGHPPLAMAIAAAITLGALTETAQLWLPHRSGDVADLIADAVGALACGAWVSRPGRRQRGVKP